MLVKGEGKEKVLIVDDTYGMQSITGKTEEFFKRLVSRIKDPKTGQAFDLARDFWHSNVSSEVIRLKQPKVIVAVGAGAFQMLVGEFRNWKGKVVGIDELRGFVFDGPGKIPVIGTYPPSYIVSGNFHLSRVSQLDILRGIEIARQGRPTRLARYILHPTVFDAKRFQDTYEEALAKDSNLPLAFDIETPYSSKAEKDEDPYEFEIEDDVSYTVLRISFAFKEDEAITFSWVEPFISISRRLLASAGPKISFNGIAYDIPRLEASGIPILGDQIDGMHLWKCYEPAFPMSLRFVVSLTLPDADQWKLKVKENEELYSCKDSDYLLRAYNKIKAKLEESGRWEMFLRHFVKCGTVLKRMSRRGVKVNLAARQEARERIEGWVNEKIAEIQPLVPMALRPKKLFKLGLETLLKKGLKREDLILVPGQIPELPKNKVLTEELLLVSAPKPLKKKRIVKSAEPKARRKQSSSESSSKKASEL
ncbi:MAG: hypothetical protein ACRENF_02580 [Thermodesulfobacteriota bacterium]